MLLTLQRLVKDKLKKIKILLRRDDGAFLFLLQIFAVFAAKYYICNIFLSTRPGNSGQRAEQG